MLVFLDFEASSLGKRSYPIEVGWAFETGGGESYLIRPASDWDEWDPKAEAIHRISRDVLIRDGMAHDAVACRMVEVLSDHDLLASAPSWDGKWLSILLRAAGFPRHRLRLRDSDDAHRECALAILKPVVPVDRLVDEVTQLLLRTEIRKPGEAPAHRALADAEEERARWLLVRSEARKLASAYTAA
ncbi:transcriptional regulator [Sphingomonas oryzagri]